jgi:beta-lactamase regulating signal transducer with metallopeptidase domain
MNKIKIGNYWILGKEINGITLFPFVFLRKSYVDRLADWNLKSLINHESIHLKQQAELGIIFFYVWYFIEYCIRVVLIGNTDAAYRRICFEKEAYVNEDNLEYIKTRKFWSFLKYI